MTDACIISSSLKDCKNIIKNSVKKMRRRTEKKIDKIKDSACLHDKLEYYYFVTAGHLK